MTSLIIQYHEKILINNFEKIRVLYEERIKGKISELQIMLGTFQLIQNNVH